MGEDFPGDGVCFLSEVSDEEVFAKEDSFVAGMAVMLEVGDVDDELVHGHTADDWAGGVVNEDLGVLFGKSAGIAVSVSNPKNSGFGVS